MKRQRGIAEGWLIGIIALVVLLAATNLATWHIAAKYTSSDWQAREAKINADAAIKIKAADDRVRASERAAGVNLAAVDAHYQTKLQEKDNALAAARHDARARGMFVNATCPANTGNATGAASASPGLGDGAARVRLSDADADFFTGIAVEADRIVEQLTAAQAVIRQDRVTCGGR